MVGTILANFFIVSCLALYVYATNCFFDDWFSRQVNYMTLVFIFYICKEEFLNILFNINIPIVEKLYVCKFEVGDEVIVRSSLKAVNNCYSEMISKKARIGTTMKIERVVLECYDRQVDEYYYTSYCPVRWYPSELRKFNPCERWD